MLVILHTLSSGAFALASVTAPLNHPCITLNLAPPQAGLAPADLTDPVAILLAALYEKKSVFLAQGGTKSGAVAVYRASDCDEIVTANTAGAGNLTSSLHPTTLRIVLLYRHGNCIIFMLDLFPAVKIAE